jgi:hypothetical protein
MNISIPHSPYSCVASEKTTAKDNNDIDRRLLKMVITQIYDIIQTS